MSGAEERSPKERAINPVTRRVMWGEDEAQILDSLHSQGYTEEDALDLLHMARRDRARTIRGIFWPKIWWGLLLIGLGVGVVLAFYYLTDTYPARGRGQIAIQLTPFIFGAWQLLSGLSGLLTAGSRSGPVSEIE